MNNLTRDNTVWLFNRAFSTHDFSHKGGDIIFCDNPKETAENEIKSLLWITYRNNFKKLPQTNLTSDTHWGCVLRTSQMMMAESMKRISLWKKQRKRTVDSCCVDGDILRHFLEDNKSMFSLEKIAVEGDILGKEIGKWFAPSFSSSAFWELGNKSGNQDVPVVVSCPSNTIYVNDVFETIFRVNELRVFSKIRSFPKGFYFPLNAPQQSSTLSGDKLPSQNSNFRFPNSLFVQIPPKKENIPAKKPKPWTQQDISYVVKKYHLFSSTTNPHFFPFINQLVQKHIEILTSTSGNFTNVHSSYEVSLDEEQNQMYAASVPYTPTPLNLYPIHNVSLLSSQYTILSSHSPSHTHPSESPPEPPPPVSAPITTLSSQISQQEFEFSPSPSHSPSLYQTEGIIPSLHSPSNSSARSSPNVLKSLRESIRNTLPFSTDILSPKGKPQIDLSTSLPTDKTSTEASSTTIHQLNSKSEQEHITLAEYSNSHNNSPVDTNQQKQSSDSNTSPSTEYTEGEMGCDDDNSDAFPDNDKHSNHSQTETNPEEIPIKTNTNIPSTATHPLQQPSSSGKRPPYLRRTLSHSSSSSPSSFVEITSTNLKPSTLHESSLPLHNDFFYVGKRHINTLTQSFPPSRSEISSYSRPFFFSPPSYNLHTISTPITHISPPPGLSSEFLRFSPTSSTFSNSNFMSLLLQKQRRGSLPQPPLHTATTSHRSLARAMSPILRSSDFSLLTSTPETNPHKTNSSKRTFYPPSFEHPVVNSPQIRSLRPSNIPKSLPSDDIFVLSSPPACNVKNNTISKETSSPEMDKENKEEDAPQLADNNKDNHPSDNSDDSDTFNDLGYSTVEQGESSTGGIITHFSTPTTNSPSSISKKRELKSFTSSILTTLRKAFTHSRHTVSTNKPISSPASTYDISDEPFDNIGMNDALPDNINPSLSYRYFLQQEISRQRSRNDKKENRRRELFHSQKLRLKREREQHKKEMNQNKLLINSILRIESSKSDTNSQINIHNLLLNQKRVKDISEDEESEDADYDPSSQDSDIQIGNKHAQLLTQSDSRNNILQRNTNALISVEVPAYNDGSILISQNQRINTSSPQEKSKSNAITNKQSTSSLPTYQQSQPNKSNNDETKQNKSTHQNDDDSSEYETYSEDYTYEEEDEWEEFDEDEETDNNEEKLIIPNGVAASGSDTKPCLSSPPQQESSKQSFVGVFVGPEGVTQLALNLPQLPLPPPPIRRSFSSFFETSSSFNRSLCHPHTQTSLPNTKIELRVAQDDDIVPLDDVDLDSDSSSNEEQTQQQHFSPSQSCSSSPNNTD